MYFAKKCHHFHDTSAPGDSFFPPNFVKHYQTSKVPSSALEQDKFLSGVKTIQILQFAQHDLNKKF